MASHRGWWPAADTQIVLRNENRWLERGQLPTPPLIQTEEELFKTPDLNLVKNAQADVGFQLMDQKDSALKRHDAIKARDSEIVTDLLGILSVEADSTDLDGSLSGTGDARSPCMSVTKGPGDREEAIVLESIQGCKSSSECKALSPKPSSWLETTNQTTLPSPSLCVIDSAAPKSHFSSSPQENVLERKNSENLIVRDSPSEEIPAVIGQLRPQQESCNFLACVLLTDASQELLLSLVPHVHEVPCNLERACFQSALESDFTRQNVGLLLNPHPLKMPVGKRCSSPHQMLSNLPPPGDQVLLEVMGIAVDRQYQALSIQGPSWLHQSCQQADIANPFMVISRAKDADPENAGSLIEKGLAGLIGGCYQSFDEGLPLTGLFGILTSRGELLLSQEQVESVASSLQGSSGEFVAEQATPEALESSSRSTLPRTRSGMRQEEAGVGHADYHLNEQQDLLGSTMAPEVEAGAPSGLMNGAEALEEKEDMGNGDGQQEDDGFKIFMQQDDVGGLAFEVPSEAAVEEMDKKHSKDGTTPVQRVRWLNDVRCGDLVEVVPLTFPSQEQLSDGGIHEEMIKGIVDEVVFNEPFQTQGVLVRLEDNTMGHVIHVIQAQHRQAQAEWPSLGPAQEKPSREEQAPEGRGRAGEVADDEPRSSSPSSRAASKKTSGRPVGGIHVIKASTTPSKLQRVMKAKTAEEEAKREEEEIVQAVEMWKSLQDAYGVFITSTVLRDCNGDVREAVGVFMDQDSMPDRLMSIVEHSVQRVEKEAAAAIAAANENEQRRQERGPQASRARRGGWGARPGAPDVSIASPNRKSRGLQPSHEEMFPSLRGSNGRRGQVYGEFDSEGQAMNGEQPAAPVTMLHNTDSLSGLARASGLQVKDAEALKQLFPTVDNYIIIHTLGDVQGDVNAAYEYFLDAGILPGPAPDMSDLDALRAQYGEDGGGSLSAADVHAGCSYLDALAPESGRGKAGDAQGGAALRGGAADDVLMDAPEEKKVDALVTNVEGLERSLAVTILSQQGGSVAKAFDYLQECVREMNKDKADKEAQSELLAATLARPSSYAGVTHDPLISDALSSGPKSSRHKLSGPSSVFGATQGADSGGGGAAQKSESRTRRSERRYSEERGLGQGAAEGLQGAGEEWQPVQRTGKNYGRDGRNGGSQLSLASRYPGVADDLKTLRKLRSGEARQKAQIYFNFRNFLFQSASAAYNAGDGRAAADFAKRGRSFDELAKKFRQMSNEEAYRSSNMGIRNEFTMDLHGMHVNEAVDMLERQLNALNNMVFPEGVLLKAITGKGTHSINNTALVRPAVLEYVRSQGYKHFIEPGNEGVVVVHVLPGTRPPRPTSSKDRSRDS